VILAVAGLLVLGLAGCASSVPAGPTGMGPSSYTTTRIGWGHGFAGGTIYTPAGPGPFGSFTIVPGYTAYQSSISWYGPLLASNGFIVLTIDTNTVLDQPAQRSGQQIAAMNYLRDRSPVASKVDPNRMAVAGWSMGGGGSLRTASTTNVKAVITLAGWEPFFDLSKVTAALLVVACRGDLIAPNWQHSDRFYSSGRMSEKAQITLSSASNHLCVTSADTDIARVVVPWAKYFVDGDVSAAAYLCPGPRVGGAIVSYRATCPIG